MCAYVRVCVFACVYICVYICVYVCLYVCLYMCLYACISACMCGCMCGCMCAYMSACVCLYVCMCDVCLLVCDSGFAIGLSVDSAAGAIYRINLLIQAYRSLTTRIQASRQASRKVKIKDFKLTLKPSRPSGALSIKPCGWKLHLRKKCTRAAV